MLNKLINILPNRLEFFKTTKQVLLILTILLFSDSCKKHGFGSVEGTVIDETTNLPLANAKIIICKSYHGNSCEPKKTVVTDENGNFKLKYYNGPSSYYDLSVSSDDSYNAVKIERIPKRKSNYTIILPMKAFVQLTIKNNRPMALWVEAKTDAEDSPGVMETINPGQTKTFTQLLRIKVGHQTKIVFSGHEVSGYIPTIINNDTTITLTQKLETLSYSTIIN